MGKNAHPPRRGGASSGSKKPSTKDDDGSFIVFTNDNDDKKGKKKDNNTSGAAQSTSEASSSKKKGPSSSMPESDDAPKKPDTRTLIGGASWTGKLPVNMLSELCQKQKWEKPDYSMHKLPDGYSSMVTLRSKNPKTQEITTLPQLTMPKEYKHLAVQPTPVEARHFAAAYALFRVNSMKNIHMMMPPKYKDLWKGEFQTMKDEDVKNGREWLYAADPFAAQREKEEIHAKMDKQRAAREKEAAAQASQPGASNLQLSAGGKDLMKGWKTAAKVEMGKQTRRTVENIVKSHGLWNPNNVEMASETRSRIRQELSGLGFRTSHIDEATSICKDKEEVLEWLLIHIPEDDLPKWALPEGYSAGVSMVSGNMKREAAIKRLASAGYSIESCEEALDRCEGSELKAAHILQSSLLDEDTGAELVSKLRSFSLNSAEANANGMWEEEVEIMKASHPQQTESSSQESCTFRLQTPNTGQPIFAQLQKPIGPYPEVLPILKISASLPSYIRLSIVKQVLKHAAANFLGEYMIYDIVDWLEQETLRIVENPGELSDISAAGGLGIEDGDRSSRPTKKRKRPHPAPISWTPNTEPSLELLRQWNTKQRTLGQQKMIKVRQSLPAWNLQEAIVSATQTHQVVIIGGETGSGKSTQSVQFILDDMIKGGFGDSINIICTQPRRISALGLADRVSDERCSKVGDEVGYSIRGESKQTPGKTKITFVTTGVLLRRMQTSGGSIQDLVASTADLSHIVVDEVHERSLDTDFLLALLRDVLKYRKDLKVILMSATLDAGVFEKYFGGPRTVARIDIQGRTFPVTDIYLDEVIRFTGHGGSKDDFESEDSGMGGIIQKLGMGINYDLIASLVQAIHKDLGDQEGGILIFLPGTVEITRALDALRMIPGLHLLPLHASLLPADQRRVFPPAPSGKRKVVAATNVAETSITIEDIVAVIDTGRVKETHFDAQTNMVKLEEVWASRAACKQRRGRAGRVRAGKCYKLYTRQAESKMMERPDPEIRRVPLEQLCLSVKAMGVDNVPQFLANTLTPPEGLAVDGAIAMLKRMGALDGEVLTALGTHMAMIPADLRCSKLMVYGALFGCLEACVIIASILTVRSPFVSPQDKRDESKAARASFAPNQGDIIADLKAYDAWAAIRSSKASSEVRFWCSQNFLNKQTLHDIASTRSQYISSLQEIGFLPFSYFSPTTASSQEVSLPLLHALVLSSLHPQTLRISYPAQKYTSTMSGAMAVDPESREIKYYDSNNARTFMHPSSTLFSAQNFPNNAGFMSYFTKMETSKVFARELTPCGAFGMLLFGGPITLDTHGRGLVVDDWIRLRGWARIGVLVGRMRAVLDGMLQRWVEEPGSGKGDVENKVVSVVKRLVELDGLDS